MAKTGARLVASRRGMPTRPIFLLGVELGELLGIPSGVLTQLRQRGVFTANDKEQYELKANVLSYVRYLRGIKQDAKTAKHLQDQALQFWKTEKVKDTVKRFRMARDRDTALAIITALMSLLAQFRDEVGSMPQVVAATDKLIAGVGAIDVDQIVCTVEGDSDDDDDDELEGIADEG